MLVILERGVVQRLRRDDFLRGLALLVDPTLLERDSFWLLPELGFDLVLILRRDEYVLHLVLDYDGTFLVLRG